MTQKIQIKRGLRSDLPNLSEGELAFCTDTKEYFIGSSSGNIKLANHSDLGSVGSAGTFGPETYSTEPLGELYYPPAIYTAWCPNGLQWDALRSTFVVLVNAANSHVFTALDHYIVDINPDTLIPSNPRLITIVDTIGNPVSYSLHSATTAFAILNDGSYVTFKKSNAETWNRLTSTDGGRTWVDRGPIVINPSLVTAYTFWSVYKLSNGRLIGGLGGHANSKAKIIVSDDNGVNWSLVTIGWDASVTGTFTAAEVCIIEVEPNKLISLARKSTSGAVAGNPPEPALIAFSSDNGSTWTPYVHSTSILNMNAASATSYVHNGIVEVFTVSRHYSTTSTAETGYNGGVYHYVAKVADSLQDKFTLKGVASYANAANSVDVHSPCVAIDNKKRMLMMYYDKSQHPTANAGHMFVRGELGKRYEDRDGTKSIFNYSGAHIERLISNLTTEIASLQYKVSLITGASNPVTAPKATLLWVKKYNAHEKNTTIFTDTDFTGLVHWTSTGTGPGQYNEMRTDANGVKYHYTGASGAVLARVTKPNFSISYKGTFGNGNVKLPVAGAIINGTVYGLLNVDSYMRDRTVIHEYRFENWNGTMKAFINGKQELKVYSAPFDATNMTNYSYLLTLMGGTYDPLKTYVATGVGNGGNIYEIKYGEWD